MTLVKRSRAARRKKKTEEKKTAPRKLRTGVGARKSRPHVARPDAKTTQGRIIGRYHELTDKKLRGTATEADLDKLTKVTAKVEAIESAYAEPFEAAAERRHQALLEKLSALTDELRKFSAAAQH
jgi:hypothetical protein